MFLITIVLANGGPVDISHFRKTGNIKLMQKADISILKEDLFIKIEDDFTIIEVTYLLKNNGEANNIMYGFPVDVYEADWFYGDTPDPNPFTWTWNKKIVEYFYAFEDSTELKTSTWYSENLYLALTENLNEGIYHEKDSINITRKWYILKLDFDKNKEKEITIKYKVENTKRDKLPGFCFIPRYTDRHFTYHLFPSSKWGDGIVNNFSVTIDISDLIKNNCDYIVEGIEGFTNIKSLYTFKTENYDLNSSDRINIHYNNTHLKMSEYIENNDIKNIIINKIYASANPEQVKNLIDNNPATCWTGEAGDWIEIVYNEIPRTKYIGNVLVSGILALNGNFSDEENYNKNGKIKFCKVLINDTIEYNTEPWNEPEGNKTIFLSENKYKNILNINGLATIIADGDALTFQGIAFLIDNKPGKLEIKKIRLKIIDIYEGEEKNHSFSISEIYLVGN